MIDKDEKTNFVSTRVSIKMRQNIEVLAYSIYKMTISEFIRSLVFDAVSSSALVREGAVLSNTARKSTGIDKELELSLFN